VDLGFVSLNRRGERSKKLTQSVRKVALIPPNMVYITTPSGRRKQAGDWS
jgi:hypothetical protein